MTTFTIENETNNITAHAHLQDAEATANARCFDGEEALAALATHWSTAQLVDIWNGLPGAMAVTKFKDRKTAISRIWKVIQPLAESLSSDGKQDAGPATSNETLGQSKAVDDVTKPVHPEPEGKADAHAPDVAPVESNVTAKANRSKKSGTGEAKAPRAEGKAKQVIAMLRREGGTTLEEIMDAMKWQKHTTRAILSAGGSLTKNHGLTVVSEKVGEQRKYSIKG
jgi:hypothetical protein